MKSTNWAIIKHKQNSCNQRNCSTGGSVIATLWRWRLVKIGSATTSKNQWWQQWYMNINRYMSQNHRWWRRETLFHRKIGSENHAFQFSQFGVYRKMRVLHFVVVPNPSPVVVTIFRADGHKIIVRMVKGEIRV